METLAQTPANADNTATADSGAADANLDKATSDGSAPSVHEADTSATKVKEDPVQKRIDQLTREKYDALRERDRKDYEIERLRAEVEQSKAPKAEIATQDEFPTLEKYGFDEGKFNAAVAAHYSKLATDQARNAARQELEAERNAERQRKSGESWAAKEAEFIKSKPDYREKVIEGGKRGDWKCTPEMAQVIRESDLGTSVAYHLAENPEKAAAIAQLPPLVQARELGRIEARIEAEKAPPKPAVSQAPAPPSKIDTDGAPSVVKVDSADSDTLSDSEWTRRRNAQEQARLRKIRGS